MRVTQVQRPFPATDCVPEVFQAFHPKDFVEAPHRFLARRPESHFHRTDPIEGYVYYAPIEAQWAGEFSAFEEGLLVKDLRDVAVLAREYPVKALAKAAMTAAEGDVELGRAFADLAVTGREAFKRFRASPPTTDAVADLLAPSLSRDQQLDWANWALKRAFDVIAALRTGFDRDGLEWIAVSAPDDRPHRPVNIPASLYPQFDLDVRVHHGTSSARLVRTRMIIASGEPPTPVAPLPRTVPVDPIPSIDPYQRVIVFVHGHTSRLEECDGLLGPLTRRGFAVVAMDLPSCGYASMIPHERIGPGRPMVPPRTFSVLDFQDQFLVDCVRTLSERLGRDISHQISAWIGGSLGGNLCLRLAGRDPLVDTSLANFVSWSAASVWTPASGLREIAAGLALQRAWEDEEESSRREYFQQAFYDSAPTVRPQAEYWYRDGWEPCKERLMIGARAERHELYNPVFRRWHWRVGMEQLYFSHREPESRIHRIRGRTLFASGTADNYDWTNIHDATRDLGIELINVPGRLLSLDDTGHSIHVERPELFARHIAAFAPPICPGGDRPEVWTEWSSLDGVATSDPTVGIQEDGRLVVFIRSVGNRILRATQNEPGGGFASWTEMGDGLDDDDRFLDGIAVGINQDGRLEIFATLGNENQLAHVWQEKPNGNWGGWAKGLIGDAASGVAVSDRVGEGPSRLLLAIARLRSGGIHVRGQNRLGSWWANGRDVGPSSGLRFIGTPAPAFNASRIMYLFARHVDGQLHRIWGGGTDYWQIWASMGEVASDPAAALDAGGRLRVFARSSVGELIATGENSPSSLGSEPFTGGSWSDWISLEGAVAENSRPAVYRNAWGQLQVFVRWQDGTIRTRRQLTTDGATWSEWLDLGGYSERNPAITENLDGTLSLFVVGAGGAVFTKRQYNPYREESLEREVTATGKNADREIISLCNDAEPWSPRAADDAIRDIVTGAHIYFVAGPSGRVEIRVVNAGTGKFLRTDPDASLTNNLDNLPDC